MRSRRHHPTATSSACETIPGVTEGMGRMEAFSDGIFAIAATLLVLEFAVGSGRDLGHELLHIWPSYLAYATSFITIGIIWINHHHTVSLLARADRTMLFVNNLLLLTIAFLPFPTKLVADYLRKDGEEAATLAYTATFVIMAVMHQVWWQYARHNRRLIADVVPDSALRAVDRAYAPGVPMYAVCLVVAFFSPLAAVFLTFAIAAFYLPSAALFDR
jgi:TMEM175 potassium channel family protein